VNYDIPFNRPTFQGKELVYIADAIQRGHISGDGEYTRKCQALLEERLSAPKVLLTTSCTDALEMAALLLKLQPGDEVIVPSFAFVSTANAFVLHGARPVFADVRPDTLNVDESKLEALISERTRAIVIIHYAGIGCEMDAIMEIAARHNVEVIEDNAHGLFAKYRGRYLGTFGGMATQSFHETKNVTCGEGGALIVNDEQYIERAQIIRDKGTNRAQLFRGQVDKYTWMDVGSSYLPSDMVAAFLYAQLEFVDRIQSTREAIWDYYYEGLRDWAASERVTYPTVPPYCRQSCHMFYILVRSVAHRQALIEHLKQQSISGVFHYLPLHLSSMGQRFGGKQGDCPVTEDVSDRLLRLPFFNEITRQEQDRVIAAIKDYKEG
jgi:dTDP-4-amino-4,6-dideoxygalactose transaminase